MASTPTYLPVYQLSTMVTPTNADCIVVQSAATGGDVGLLPISTFINTFLKESMDAIEIDDSVKTKYENMGWTEPT